MRLAFLKLHKTNAGLIGLVWFNFLILAIVLCHNFCFTHLGLDGVFDDVVNLADRQRVELLTFMFIFL